MTAEHALGPSANCAHCGSGHPPAARFCSQCGHVVGGSGTRQPYAAQPNESVASLSIVSTVMPYASARSPQTYKVALAVGVLLPIVAVLLGSPAFALTTAAFVVPVVFIVYLYDVNLWEDQPVPVVLGTFVLGGALAGAFTWLWRGWLVSQPGGVSLGVSNSFQTLPFVVACVVVPVVAVVLMLIGPVVLASRPAFDDLIDGLTFGVVSGVAYAAIETLVVNWGVISGGAGAGNVAGWVAVLLNVALLKPLVYGCAVGIAAAEFSGLGEGYDGLTGRFLARVGEAMAAIVLYQSGLYLTGLAGGTTGVVLGLLWALVVTAVVVLRLRSALQRGLLEGAMEAAARDGGSKWASGPDDFCPECEMPLLVGSNFCSVCGASVRARSKAAREHGVRAADGTPT